MSSMIFGVRVSGFRAYGFRLVTGTSVRADAVGFRLYRVHRSYVQ